MPPTATDAGEPLAVESARAIRRAERAQVGGPDTDPDRRCSVGIQQALKWALKAKETAAGKKKAAIGQSSSSDEKPCEVSRADSSQPAVPASRPVLPSRSLHTWRRPTTAGEITASGTEAKFLPGAAVHEEAARLLGEGGIENVKLCCYSFDVACATKALCALGSRGQVLMDHRQCFGRTKAQLQRASQLETHGLELRVSRGSDLVQAYASRERQDINLGPGLKGIVHGKSFFMKKMDGKVLSLIGLASWSDATVANVESQATTLCQAGCASGTADGPPA
jgi:hypothetical protein